MSETTEQVQPAQDNTPKLDPATVQEIVDRLHTKLWIPFNTAIEHEQFMEGPTTDEKITAIFSYLTGLYASVLGSMMVTTTPPLPEEQIRQVWNQFANNIAADFNSRVDAVLTEMKRKQEVQTEE